MITAIFNLFFFISSAAVEEVKLKDTQYTLEHMRAFGMYNYLHLDPWYEDSVYFVDCKGRVLNLTVTLVSLQILLFFGLFMIVAPPLTSKVFSQLHYFLRDAAHCSTHEHGKCAQFAWSFSYAKRNQTNKNTSM